VQLVLASNSPRRRQLLKLSGWSFTARSAEVDETPLPGERAVDYVLRLAASKAEAVAQALGQEAGHSLILAADTTVVDCRRVNGALQEIILGKPADAAEAEAMLRGLRGRTHQVYTGLAVLLVADDRLLQDWCLTGVRMRNYSDAELLAYIDSGDPFDKAGAYAVQHSGFHPVENLQGCYANVIGLPICHITRILAGLELPPDGTAAIFCRSSLPHACEISRQTVELA
jgi:MAF protein